MRRSDFATGRAEPILCKIPRQRGARRRGQQSEWICRAVSGLRRKLAQDVGTPLGDL